MESSKLEGAVQHDAGATFTLDEPVELFFRAAAQVSDVQLQ